MAYVRALCGKICHSTQKLLAGSARALFVDALLFSRKAGSRTCDSCGLRTPHTKRGGGARGANEKAGNAETLPRRACSKRRGQGALTWRWAGGTTRPRTEGLLGDAPAMQP